MGRVWVNPIRPIYYMFYVGQVKMTQHDMFIKHFMRIKSNYPLI